MNIVWVPRSVWGVSANTRLFILGRDQIVPEDLISIHVHHTATVDADDATPNRWDYDEAVAYIQQLQTSRPDLGPLPYNDNVAVSEDLQTVWVFEGRGWNKQGAHTANHNTTGYGIGVFGNFDKPDTDAADAALEAIVWRVRQVIANGAVNLGTLKNPNGWDLWGHRDTSTKTCPGHSLYPLIPNHPLFEGDDMSFSKGLSEPQWRALYQKGVAKGSSEQAVVNYWVGDAANRTDAEHDHASASMFTELALRPSGGGISEADAKALIAGSTVSPPP